MLSWLCLLLIIDCIVGKTIYYDSKFGYDADRVRSRRQINFSARMLGEECETNNECRRTPVDGTKICLSNQCQCSSGHVPIDAYRCIRDFEQLSTNIQVTKASEIEESPGLTSINSNRILTLILF